MYSRLSQTSFKTLEDCSHLLQLPVRQHVRVVCHVGAHPHLDQQSHTMHLLAPAPQNQKTDLRTDTRKPRKSQWRKLREALENCFFFVIDFFQIFT